MDLHEGPAVLSSAAGLSFPVVQEAAKVTPLTLHGRHFLARKPSPPIVGALWRDDPAIASFFLGAQATAFY